MTTRWLIPRLPLFRAVHPDIQINVVYALDAQTPEAISVDLLIRHGLRPSTAAIPMLSAATRPTCAPSFIERRGPFATPSALKSTELLHDETTTAWARWFSTQGLSAKLNVSLQFADFNLLIGSVLAGQGVGLCPTALIQDELSRGILVTLFDQPSDKDKSYWLMARDTLSHEAMILRDWIIKMSMD